jgi:hypothetical protein
MIARDGHVVDAAPGAIAQGQLPDAAMPEVVWILSPWPSPAGLSRSPPEPSRASPAKNILYMNTNAEYPLQVVAALTHEYLIGQVRIL